MMPLFDQLIEPMTLGNMRELGARSLDVSCWNGHHQGTPQANVLICLRRVSQAEANAGPARSIANASLYSDSGIFPLQASIFFNHDCRVSVGTAP
jgi:hypothetical protein